MIGRLLLTIRKPATISKKHEKWKIDKLSLVFPNSSNSMQESLCIVFIEVLMWCGGTNQIKSVQPGEHTRLSSNSQCTHFPELRKDLFFHWGLFFVYNSWNYFNIFFLPQIYETLVTNHPVYYVLRVRDGISMNLHLKAMTPFWAIDLRRDKRTSVRCPSLVFTRRKYLVSAGVADFYIDSSLSWPYLVVPRLSPRWRSFDGCSLRKSRSRWFFRDIGSQNFQIYRPIYGAVLEQPSLPSKSSDRAMSLLVSPLDSQDCVCCCLPGSHRLKVRIVVRLDFASKISLPAPFFLLLSLSLRFSRVSRAG